MDLVMVPWFGGVFVIFDSQMMSCMCRIMICPVTKNKQKRFYNRTYTRKRFYSEYDDDDEYHAIIINLISKTFSIFNITPKTNVSSVSHGDNLSF